MGSINCKEYKTTGSTPKKEKSTGNYTISRGFTFKSLICSYRNLRMMIVIFFM